ncbi:YrzI family small protein [Bacillus safensis]|nr:YrzI family small protein [Bacillus safensis]MCM2984340.1 YrzI family small protein [Bacillus safensis]MCY7448475.1 YrzI family small protein [Bacillus safensis]MCY7458081.1 YrzI family small protein [Bacillus safensis]MEC0922726.1 YrzI family small protein [Bacillus safensis]MEC0995807.1 YrzI family small protein [Bacillus safensis]
MTIHLFFITLTIKRRYKDIETVLYEQEVETIYEEMKQKQLKYMN